MGDEASSSSAKPKRTRNAFPRVALKSVVELVDAIYSLGHGEPVRRREAFENIGRSPESSASYTLISAANGGYNLVKGGKTATHLELTPTGESIAKSKDKARRTKAVNLFLSNDFFAGLVGRFGDKPMPNDSVAIDYLVRDHKLHEQDAESCWAVIKENLADFGLLEESNGKQVIVPKEVLESGTMPEGEESADNAVDSSFNEKPKEENSTKSKQEKPGSFITPQVAFNIQVVLPDNADTETYDAIFGSIAKHLLTRPE